MQKSTKRALSFSVLIAAAVVFGMVVAGSVNVTPRSEAQREAPARPRAAAGIGVPSFADIAEEAMPSVVSITSTDIVKGAGRRGSPFGGGGSQGEGDPFEFFFGPRRNQPRGDDEEHKEVQGGTGFVISDDGYVVTNNHVVENADRVEVRLAKERFPAKIIGRDPATDLALLKIDARRKLAAIPLGDSDRLRVGEWVMAIGDPLTFDKTVTVGVVSAKERSGLTADAATRSFENFIQTDAAINFGNSGGPLINVNGEVIGINTAMFRPAQNIGFAVPINTLKQVLPQLRDKGKVTRGYLGINIRNVDPDVAAAFRLKGAEGAFVESVVKGEPADKAGLQPGDTIVRVDNVPVKETRDLIGYVSAKPPGTRVKLSVMRDGKEAPFTVTLAERGADSTLEAQKGSKGGDESRGKIGISVQSLTPEIRRMAGLESGVEGLYVQHVKEVSPAADAQLREGDVITSVNGKPIGSTEEFGKIVKNTPKGEYLRFYVLRPQAKQSFFALVKIDD
ncbi:MAG: Do family serine endopeptidase [Acidobacteria bacterium]|nr:Do family serine endopeptidase [Acidobacteriota bacterium]MCA1610036.1 Do family serine endopeptidase [Acidobacteriota bacterium]